MTTAPLRLVPAPRPALRDVVPPPCHLTRSQLFANHFVEHPRLWREPITIRPTVVEKLLEWWGRK